MSSLLANAKLEIFSPFWRPQWRGPRRLAMLTSSLADPQCFVAYGTDGFIAFCVEGTWRDHLSPFLALMDADGAELIAPPRLSSTVLHQGEFTYPGRRAVQIRFDEVLLQDDRRLLSALH